MVPALKIAALASSKADTCVLGIILHVVSLFVLHRSRRIQVAFLTCTPETRSFSVIHFSGTAGNISPIFLSHVVWVQSSSFCVSGDRSH